MVTMRLDTKITCEMDSVLLLHINGQLHGILIERVDGKQRIREMI